MKRILPLLTILILLAAPAAIAAPSGYYIEDADAGVRILIDENWIDAAMEYQVLHWTFTDVEGVDAFVALMAIEDLDSVRGDTDAQIGAQLRELGVLLAGVVVREEGKPALGIPDGAETTELPAQNGYAFTFFRVPDAKVAPALDEAARAVYAAFADPGAVVVTSRPGFLGIGGLSFTSTLLNGEAVTQDIFAQGDVTVLNVWATYCGVCLSEMPTLEKLHLEYLERGVRFLGLVSDVYPGDSTAQAQALAERTGVTYPSMIVDPSLMPLLSQVQYVPTTYLLNALGEVLSGPIVGGMDEAAWRALLDGVLAR